MKVLYVEDQLEKQLELVSHVFAPLFDSDTRKDLEELRKLAESGFPVTKEDVRKILDSTGLIDACYTLPDALAKLVPNPSKYGLILVDRDLSDGEYTREQIREVLGGEWPSDAALDYYGEKHREGDLILSVVRDKIDAENMFYFLTANTDEIVDKSAEPPDRLLERLYERNLLEKGKVEHVERLTGLIKEFKVGNQRSRMREVFAVFDEGLLPEDVEREFEKAVVKMDDHNAVEDNLARLRRIQEAIYQALSKASDELVPTASLIRNDKGELNMRKLIRSLAEDGTHSGVIKSFAYDIYGIASESGSHHSYEKPDYPPTKYTVIALTYAMCDLLLWFKETMGKVDR